MELEAVLAVYGDDCAILDSFPPHLHLHSKSRTVDISSQQVHHSLSPSFTFGVCLFFGFEEQNSRKHFLGNKNDSYCRYTTSGDGSRFFVYLTKRVFFLIGGNKDFIGVAI
jgi:hypothetical protein